MAQAQDETPDKRTPEDTVKYYHEQLDLAKKDHKNFHEDGEKVNRRFKNGRDALRARTKRLNILYSNTEVLRAALYGKSARPDVRRRFGMEDKVAGTVSSVIEKSLIYCQEAYDADKQIELGILDYLLPGRGVIRVEYDPTVSTHPDTKQEYVTKQIVRECYVHWKDFLHMPARTWNDILKNGWVSFAHRMTRAELVSNFGDVGTRVPLNWMPDIANKKDAPESLKKAEVFEIWDVNDRKRYWVVEGFAELLRADDDPYGLEQFFPLPEPPAYYITTDSVIPEPEFHIYQDQADDLDEIIARISRLTKALKRRGVYDQSVKELAKLATAADNQFIAVENYQSLATKGGLAAAFQTEDISIIATVLLQLFQQKDQLVQTIWELCGIADIMRGQTQASETLGAQQLKAQFGSQRLKRRQRAIQKWVAALLKLKAEIIAEHFTPEMLQEMTSEKLVPQPPPPAAPPPMGAPPEAMQAFQQQQQQAQQAFLAQKQQSDQIMQVLRSDKLRAYRVDIETDSTVFEDAQEEQQSRAALVTAVSQFITAWGPIVESSPPMAPIAFELLKFGVEAFKSTRGIEDAIEQAEGMLQQQAAQPKPPTPEQQKVQAEAQQGQQKLDIEKQKTNHAMAMKERETQLEHAKAAHEIDLKERAFKLEQMKATHEADMKHAESINNMVIQGEQHRHDKKTADREFALKAQDFVSQEHERQLQKGERDRQFEHDSTMQKDERIHSIVSGSREHDLKQKQMKQDHSLRSREMEDKAAERKEAKAGKTDKEPDKKDDTNSKVVEKLTDTLDKIVVATTKPKTRTAIRDKNGDIVKTVEE